MPLNPVLHKVMIIGSGPIVIGQAAEFDYAGSQACRALKDAGLEVVLVNPNPATIMTDHSSADHIYIEPLTLETLRRIILKEKPDSLLSTLGGQSGLTLSMQLAKEGFLEQHGVKLLGAKCETIEKAEDRQQFKDTMLAIHQPVIPSEVVETVEDALAFAQTIGYPVIVRPAYTLGGSGGGICQDEKELAEMTAFLQEHGFEVVGTILPDECCHMLLVKRDLKPLRDSGAEAIVGMACGDGVQTVADNVKLPVLPANDTLFLGQIERAGVFHEACRMCGDCMLGQTGGICPVTQCAKSLVHGPCGGQRNARQGVVPEMGK